MGLAWQAAARALFESCDQVLIVGAKNFGHPGARQLEDLRAAQAVAHGPYPGIVWRVRSALGRDRHVPLAVAVLDHSPNHGRLHEVGRKVGQYESGPRIRSRAVPLSRAPPFPRS